jgi:NAD-dependent DNA ligase
MKSYRVRNRTENGRPAYRVAVSTSVTKSLAFLCADENAGPVKLMKAKAQGIVIFMPQKEKSVSAQYAGQADRCLYVADRRLY